MPTCSLGFVPAGLVTAANVQETKAAGMLLDRAAQLSSHLELTEIDGIQVGARMREAAERHGLDVQPYAA